MIVTGKFPTPFTVRKGMRYVMFFDQENMTMSISSVTGFTEKGDYILGETATSIIEPGVGEPD